jgi:hypothetical protein
MYSYCYVCSLLYILFSPCQLAPFGYPDRFFRAFSLVVRHMPGYNSQRRDTAHTLPKLIVLFCVLYVCKCVLYYCHRVSTQLRLTNMYHIPEERISQYSFWNSYKDATLLTLRALRKVLISLRESHWFYEVYKENKLGVRKIPTHFMSFRVVTHYIGDSSVGETLCSLRALQK